MPVGRFKTPDGRIARFNVPEGIPPEEAQAYAQQYFTKQEEPQEPEEDIGFFDEIGRGIKVGTERTKALVADAGVGLIKDIIGDEEGAKIEFQAYQQKLEELERLYPSHDILESPKEFALGSARLFGEGLPSVGVTIAGAGAGFVATGFNPLGAAVGAVASSYLLNTPESYVNLLEEGDVDNPEYWSLGIGALKSGLDFLPLQRVFSRTFGKAGREVLTKKVLEKSGLKKAAKEVGKEALRVMRDEGLTEAAQEALDVAAENVLSHTPDGFFTKENLQRIGIAGYGGVLVGGAVGTGAKTLETIADSGVDKFQMSQFLREKGIEENEIDALFSEEVVGPSGDLFPETLPTQREPKKKKPKVAKKEELVEEAVPEVATVQEDLFRDLTPEEQKIKTTLGVSDAEAISTYEELTPTETKLQKAKPSEQLERRDIGFGLFQLSNSNIGFVGGVQTEGLGTPGTARLRFDIYDLDAYNPEAPEQAQSGFAEINLELEENGDLTNVVEGLVNIEIPKNKRGKGVAQRAVNGLMANTKDGRLNIYDIQPKAKAFWENLGIKYTDKRERDGYLDNIAFQKAYAEQQPTETTGGDIPLAGQLDYKPIGMNLEATTINPDVTPQWEQSSKIIDDITRKVGGPQAKTLKVGSLRHISPESRVQLVRGAQHGNLIITSLELNLAQPDAIVENTFHENWHLLENNGAFTASDRSILDRDTLRLKKYLIEDMGVPFDTVEGFGGTAEGLEELRAYTFGVMAKGWYKEGKFGREHGKLGNEQLGVFKKAFRTLMDMMDKIRRAMGGTTIEDLFADAFAGKKQIKDTLDAYRQTRLQKVEDVVKQAHQKELTDLDAHLDRIVETAEKSTGEKIGALSAFWGSMPALAGKEGLVAHAVEIVRARLADTNKLTAKYHKAMRNFENKPKEVRRRLYEIAQYLNETNQTAEYDEEGKLIYNRGTKAVRVNDVEMSQAYRELQEGLRLVLEDKEAYVRSSFLAEFPEFSEDFTLEDINEYLETESDLTDSQVTKLNNAVTQFTNLEKAKRIDYFPRMRFGEGFFAVYEKGKDGAIDYRKVERISTLKKFKRGMKGVVYDPDQLDEVYQDFVKKYSDTSKYTIMGNTDTLGAPQKVSLANPANFKPGHSLYNEKQSRINEQFVTLDTLSEILGSRVDEAGVAGIRDTLMKDIQSRGFQKHFLRSDKIPGFSTDYDRVHAVYFSGAAHSLANLNALPKLANLRKVVDSLPVEKERTKNLVNKYLDYNLSPQEDMARWRLLNFVYALGFNVSSAALQFVTLPTFTAARMTQFNGNYLKNQASLMRWGKYSSYFLKESFNSRRNGILNLTFDQDKAWAKIQKAEGLTDEEIARYKAFAIDIHDRGDTAAQAMQEYMIRDYGQIEDKITKKVMETFQGSGMMISTAEQMTRFGTMMATFDMLAKDPQAMANLEATLPQETEFWNVRKGEEKELAPEEFAASFLMSELHGIMGRVGRPQAMKGIGGAIVMPFMSWVGQILELMVRQGMTKGTNGKKSLAMAVGSLVVLSGLVGIPGGELLKELSEWLYENYSGVETDIDLIIREAMAELTGTDRVGLALTQGVPRAIMGVDIAKRVGLPIPGQELVLNLLGIRGEASDILGVQGSILSGVGRSWHAYNTEAGASAIAQEALPIAFANVAKALEYSKNGVRTREGRTQLVGYDEVDAKMIGLRIMGITDARISNRREQNFYSQVLDREHRPGYDKYKSRMKNHLFNYYKALEKGNQKAADAQYQKYQDDVDDLTTWATKRGFYIPLSSMMQTVRESVQQRLNPQINPMDFSKGARRKVHEMTKLIGK